MNNVRLFALTVCLLLNLNLLSVFAQKPLALGHVEGKGTQYGDSGVNAYAATRHGSDGKHCLDPFIFSFLSQLEGETVLDAGCGAGPWSVYAAKNGACVHGIDLQPRMLVLAKEEVANANVEDRVRFDQGDVAYLPYPNNVFDKALSINVGCNLPASTQSITEAGLFYEAGLLGHVKEIARTLKKGGTAFFSAPANFDIVFTKNVDAASVQEKISQVLKQVEYSTDNEAISQALNTLDDVLRATFVKRDGHLLLVNDETMLVSGEPIWRKIPGLVVPNNYHSEKEYEDAFKAAGLKVQAVHQVMFKNEAELMAYNQNVADADQLGSAYVGHHAFAIFEVVKQ